MKTNVVLSSQDRVLYNITIRQETKTGFLNLSDLQEAYTQARVKHGWMAKNVSEILTGKENVERIYYLLKKQDVINIDFSIFMEMVEKETLVKVLKEVGAYRTTGARKSRTTWANPYIWVLLAMELSPKFYAEAVTWLTDKLLISRIEAGNFYKALAKALGTFENPDYPAIAKALNYIVFGKHETGIRNSASEAQLKQLTDIESKMAFAIDMGYIKTQEDLLEELRKLYKKHRS